MLEVILPHSFAYAITIKLFLHQLAGHHEFLELLLQHEDIDVNIKDDEQVRLTNVPASVQ